jgi:hypothetical protein
MEHGPRKQHLLCDPGAEDEHDSEPKSTISKDQHEPRNRSHHRG